MPKLKRGRRHHHTKFKNYERTWQNHPKPLCDVTNKSATCLKHLNVTQSSLLLPQWHITKGIDYVELSYLQTSTPSIVKFSVKVCDQLKWNVRVYGRLIPSGNVIYEEYPTDITSVETLTKICTSVEGMKVCTGNEDDSFVNILRDKGGAIKRDETVTAYLDVNCNCVRHSECLIMTKESGRCMQYRSTLRTMKSKSQNHTHESSLSHSSHTNYRYLEADELVERLRNVQAAKKKAQLTVHRLEERLQSIIEKEGVDLLEEDAADLNDVMNEMDATARQKIARSQFQSIFWEQQQKYNKLRDKRQMRWHPLMVRFALNLKYLSSSAYHAVGNFIALPSRRTLCDYTHVMSVNAGVSREMIARLKEDMKFDSCDSSEKIVGVMLDEMKVKNGLVFNKKTDKLVGFVDLGSINHDMEALQSSLTTGSSPKLEIANSMLVYMVRLLRRPSFNFPVAQHPTSSLSGDKLYPITWDVVEALELSDLQVTVIYVYNKQIIIVIKGNEYFM